MKRAAREGSSGTPMPGFTLVCPRDMGHGSELALAELSSEHGTQVVRITQLKFLFVDITHFASALAGYQATYLELSGRPRYEPLESASLDEYRAKLGD